MLKCCACNDKKRFRLKITDLRSQYYVQAREALSKANAEVDMLSAILKGREDSVTRLTVRSPVRGIVKISGHDDWRRDPLTAR